MDSPPPDRCGYTWSRDRTGPSIPLQQSCCWREASVNTDCCVWHADPETVTKSVQALEDVRSPPETRDQNSPYAELLDGANLAEVELGVPISFESVALRDSDLSGAYLRSADFSDADFQHANLSDTHFRDADLSGAHLSHADLSDADLRGADLSSVFLRDTYFSGANLRRANFSGADLRRVNLSESNLRNVDLSGNHFRDTNFSGSNLRHADLSGADLRGADFSDTDLRGADLSGADLRGADFSDTDLRGADLSDADLRETTFDNEVSVDGATICRRLFEGHSDKDSITRSILPSRPARRFFKDSEYDARDWDAISRAYHDLKTVFDAHGLIGKARDMHVRERRARSLEAKEANGVRNLRYIKSLPSRVFTGYGVSVLTLGSWMVALFLASTAFYVAVGVRPTLVGNISYSILAFTVAPPPPIPSEVWTQLVMMVETFFGTLSIVLMGYILGNREQF